MVKYKKKILLLLIIGIMIFFPHGVKAAKLATCRYNIDTNRLGIADADGLYLTVDVNSDGSTSNRKIVTGNWSKTPEPGLQIKDTIWYLQYSKMFDKNGKFYTAYKENNSCPDMQFISKTGTYQLSIYVGSGVSAGPGETSTTVHAVQSGGSSSNKTYYCGTSASNGISRPVDAIDKTASLKFYKEGNTKKLEIIIDGESNIMEASAAMAVAGVTFTVRKEDIDTYWSSSCNGDTNLFFKRLTQDKLNLEITTVRPADTENGAYKASDASKDTGKIETVENNATLEGLNQTVACSTIFDMREGHFGWLIQKILDYIKVAGPILVVLLSAIDFIKAIASSEEDAYKKAQSKLIIRLIAALALFLIPTIVSLLLQLINGIADPTCGFH